MKNTLEKWIRKNIYDSSGRINSHSSKKVWWIKKKFNVQLNDLYIQTSFLNNSIGLGERIRYILQEITAQKKCYCGNYIILEREYCSAKCVGNSPVVKTQKKKNCFKNCGFDHPTQNPQIKEKIKETCLEKYGVEYPKQIHISKETLEKLSDPVWLKEQNHKLKKSLVQIANELDDIRFCAIGEYFHKYNIKIKTFSSSVGEKDLSDFIKSIYSGPIVENDRSVLKPKELDVYLPELGIAFEYNGEYWHSEGHMKPIGYHRDKSKLCRIKGIKLYHVWERHWENKQEKIERAIINIIKGRII